MINITGKLFKFGKNIFFKNIPMATIAHKNVYYFAGKIFQY